MAFLKQAVTWALPHGFYLYLNQSRWRNIWAKNTFLKYPLQLAAHNSEFRDLHRGQRCFIVCNGPSINSQDLLPLKHEVVFSVSNGYHHKDYLQIRPRYHCVPQLTYGKITTSDAIAWFQEMHGKLGDAELFLNYTEEPLVRAHGLFPGRRIHYICLHDSFDQHGANDIVDISDTMPRVQSVPIMCLMIAMYMGFREIYLLGTEHDHFKTRRYEYFYQPTVLKEKDASVTPGGVLTISRYVEFSGLLELWKQYRRIKEIAGANSITIYNATRGGELDEFPRIDLVDALQQSSRNEEQS